MCGIFGILSKKNSDKTNFALLNDDINILTKKSELRGSDTFGLLIKNHSTSSIFKINEKPSKVIKRNDYKNFINRNLINNLDYLSIICQTRLVTNGSKFSEDNNQPILTENIIGVHNGIFVDLEKDDNENKTKNYESYSIKSDSLKFYEILSHSFDKNNFTKNLLCILFVH